MVCNDWRGLIVFTVICVLIASGWAANVTADESIHIHVGDEPEHEVRFITGETVYVEALVGGQWVGRHWNCSGNQDGEGWEDTLPAFEIKVRNDPQAQDAMLLSNNWQWIHYDELPGDEQIGKHSVVTLANTALPLGLKVHTLLDGTAVLTRWLELTNSSEEALALVSCYPWAGRLWEKEGALKVGRATRSDVTWEGWFGWEPLKSKTNVFSNDRGLAWDDAYFMLPSASGDEYFFGQLAWAVNYRMEFDKDSGLCFKVGPTAESALRVMAPGETIKTPAVHLGYTKGNFDAAVQAMHRHIRRSVLPDRKPEKAYRIQYLIPEDQPLTVFRGDDYNEANIKKCMEVATAVGVEVFIVDGPTWAEGTKASTFHPGYYGNWNAKEKWFPNGFDSLRDFAHQRGILFGLYAEPAGGRGNWSQTSQYKQHPDWFVNRRPIFPGRNFLNISIPEAKDFLWDQMRQIVDSHQLDLFRFDQNGCEGGQGSETIRHGFLESDYWRHYEALYSTCERLHRESPHLIMQQAAAGACRLDLATIERFHEHFTSDRTCHPYVYQMASGMSVYLPPEILVTANGMCGKDSQPDLVTMLRGIYTLGNTPMIFNAMLPGTVDEFDPLVLRQWQKYANLYKTFIRPLLSTCEVYHHAPVNASGGVESGDWFAMEFMSADRKRGWATIIRLSEKKSGAKQSLSYLFKPRGLNGEKTYRVTFDNARETQMHHGQRLMDEGLEIKVKQTPYSELLLFEIL